MTKNNILGIRYVKIKYTVVLTDDCTLPKYKASMLRGGIGEMLLRANCIRDRNCESCDFEEECIVQRTMYSKFKQRPEFVSNGESVGYILECESLKQSFQAGDTFSFYLILFGKTIVYFSQYLNAIYALGNFGVGKDNAHFQIVSVQNSYGKHILNDHDVFMENYIVETVSDYVEKRMATTGLKRETVIRFCSPVSIKYNGQNLEEFHATALFRSLVRRIYMLDCFEEMEGDGPDIRTMELPVITCQECYKETVPRFSNRKQQKIYLHGIKGRLTMEGINEECFRLLLAGEILHIGKNTSFGFGRYVVEE